MHSWIRIMFAAEQVGNVFAAPGPAAVLQVIIFERSPKCRRGVGVHRNRVKKRFDAEVPVIAEIALPENPRVLGDDVFVPVADVNERPQGD